MLFRSLKRTHDPEFNPSYYTLEKFNNISIQEIIKPNADKITRKKIPMHMQSPIQRINYDKH